MPVRPDHNLRGDFGLHEPVRLLRHLAVMVIVRHPPPRDCVYLWNLHTPLDPIVRD